MSDGPQGGSTSAREGAAADASASAPARGAAGAAGAGGAASAGGGCAAPPAEEWPAAIGPYRILGVVGRGGMGIVYRAVHAELKRECALKVLLGGSPTATLERFKREAETIARIGKHAHIVTCFDAGIADGRVYLAMELIAGRDLGARLDQGGPLPEQDAIDLLRKVAIAVAHAHSRGVIHRDLKPQNIIIDEHGEPQLTDFGLALDLSGSKLTVTGAVVGTPDYMAPEQVCGRRELMGPHTDVFALGATLFDALTGRPPFEGPVVEVVTKIVTQDTPLLRSVRPEASAEVEAIVAKATARSPRRRYASALELADDLTRVLRGEAPRAPRIGLVRRAERAARRHRGAAALVVAAALAAVVLAVAWQVRAWRARARHDAAVALSLEALAAPSLDGTIAALERASALDPSWTAFRVELATAYSERAVSRYRDGEWAGYDDDLRRAAALADEASAAEDDASALHLAGTLYEWLGAYDAARDRYRRAAGAQHDAYHAGLARAALALLERRFDDAEAAASATIDAGSDAALHRFRRSIARLYRGELEGALADAEQAVLLQPTDDWHFVQRARVRLARGELRLAALDAVEAVRLYPRSTAGYDVLAAIAAAEGDAARAARLAERAAAQARVSAIPAYLESRGLVPPERAVADPRLAAHLERAAAALERGNAAAALAEASAAIGLSPAHGDAHALRARAFGALGLAADAALDEAWAALLLAPPAAPPAAQGAAVGGDG